MSTKKNQAKEATKNVQSAQVSNPEVAAAETKAQQAKEAAKKLAKEAKKAAAEAKEAAKAAKEAAKKAKAFGSRPVRKNTFIVKLEIEADVTQYKSDVHYCAEKWAIDYCAAQREDKEPEEWQEVRIFRQAKDDTEGVGRQLFSRVYLDKETQQIVID